MTVAANNRIKAGLLISYCARPHGLWCKAIVNPQPNFSWLPCVPLREFTVENLRIMIGQDIGLEFLIPLALERLRDSPLAEGDCYPGDLLANVLRADATFWKDHTDLLNAVRETADDTISLLRNVPEVATGTVRAAVVEACDEFKKRVA